MSRITRRNSIICNSRQSHLCPKYPKPFLKPLEIPPLEQGMEANPSGFKNPSERGLPYHHIEIKTSDGIVLRGWKVLQINSKERPTIVFFHENAGNIGTRLSFIEELYKRNRVNVIIVAYRGYSYSDGKPSEKGLMIDSHTIMEYATSQSDIDLKKVFVMGRSLGGAVAIYSMSSRNYNIAGLILENTFTSIPDMVEVIFPAVSFLKGLVLRNYWPSNKRISKITTPTLFVKAEKDEIVPPIMMDQLYNLANPTKKFMVFNLFLYKKSI